MREFEGDTNFQSITEDASEVLKSPVGRIHPEGGSSLLISVSKAWPQANWTKMG